MRITICDSKKELGFCAAREGAAKINDAIREYGEANVVFVTGKSQVEMLYNLVKEDISWSDVNIYHLDEFVGLKATNHASSSFFLREHLLATVGNVKSYTPIDSSEKNLEKTVKVLNEKLKDIRMDVGFICIGENGHLAFNDPPANFLSREPYIIVDLEKRSRRQQVNEGWFANLDDVPTRAITMSIAQIMKTRHIIVACPDQRKAKAIAACLFDDDATLNPSAVLRRAYDCSLYLDRLSSSLVFSDGRSY